MDLRNDPSVPGTAGQAPKRLSANRSLVQKLNKLTSSMTAWERKRFWMDNLCHYDVLHRLRNLHLEQTFKDRDANTGEIRKDRLKLEAHEMVPPNLPESALPHRKRVCGVADCMTQDDSTSGRLSWFLSSTAPRMEYRRRNQEFKSVLHWGQRKLLLSEIMFLTRYAALPSHEDLSVSASDEEGARRAEDARSPGVKPWKSIPSSASLATMLEAMFPVEPTPFTPTTLVVYAGAAQGFHLPLLERLFPAVVFLLVDPRSFVLSHFTKCDEGAETDLTVSSATMRSIVHRPKGTRRLLPLQAYMDEAFATELRQWLDAYPRKMKVLFISDIRRMTESGENDGLGVPILSSNPAASQYEREVSILEDMKLQEDCTIALRPDNASLKFRLPWLSAFPTEAQQQSFSQVEKATIPPLNFSTGQLTYLDGKVLLQPFSPPTSTETRLFVSSDNQAEKSSSERFSVRQWDCQAYEEQLFYHNKVTRSTPLRCFDTVLNHIASAANWEFPTVDDPDPELRSRQRDLKLLCLGGEGLDSCFDCSFEIDCLRSYLTSEHAKMTVCIRTAEVFQLQQYLQNASQAGDGTRSSAALRELSAMESTATTKYADNEGSSASRVEPLSFGLLDECIAWLPRDESNAPHLPWSRWMYPAKAYWLAEERSRKERSMESDSSRIDANEAIKYLHEAICQLSTYISHHIYEVYQCNFMVDACISPLRDEHKVQAFQDLSQWHHECSRFYESLCKRRYGDLLSALYDDARVSPLIESFPHLLSNNSLDTGAFVESLLMIAPLTHWRPARASILCNCLFQLLRVQPPAGKKSSHDNMPKTRDHYRRRGPRECNDSDQRDEDVSSSVPATTSQTDTAGPHSSIPVDSSERKLASTHFGSVSLDFIPSTSATTAGVVLGVKRPNVKSEQE